MPSSSSSEMPMWAAQEIHRRSTEELLRLVIAERDRLREAAQAVVDSWDTRDTGWHSMAPSRVHLKIDDLRAALAPADNNEEKNDGD